MPTTIQTPGVYIQETPDNPHQIVPAETGITLILGEFADGRDWPEHGGRFYSVQDCEALYGPMTAGDPLCTAIRRYFDEGGLTACLGRYDPAAGYGVDGLAERVAEVPGFDIIITAPPAPETDWAALLGFAQDQQAFLILDGPLDGGVLAVPAMDEALLTHGALYSPWLMPGHDPQAPAEPPSAAVAGVFARTDAAQGVWKAPAGTMATINAGVMRKLSVHDQATMSQAGQNAIRVMTGFGTVIWGARTLGGGDTNASEYRYIPAIRLAQFVMRSVSEGLTFAVFEPNDRALWSKITHACDGFMQDQWAAGAFVGASAKDAYFIHCDATTTTPADIADGIANVQIGFAPIHPAEFLVLMISVKTAAGV